MKKSIKEFINTCDICQCHKGETIQALGLLQQLPNQRFLGNIFQWTSSKGFHNVILVLLDRLTKHAHYPTPTRHLMSATYSWSTFSNSMICPNPSSMIEIPLSLSSFGKNYSNCKLSNLSLVQHNIPKWMGKPRK